MPASSLTGREPGPNLDCPAIVRRLDALARRFGPRMILGLSGGGDSTALAAVIAASHHREGFVCVCVDHALRPGSAAECAAAAAVAGGLGLAARIVTLKPATGPGRLQERARTARHAALAEAARTHGASVIALAHTAEDQAETLAFRLARKTGLDGLAGMASVAASPVWSSPGALADDTLWPCVVARPLLDQRRAALRRHLRAAGLAWSEDPSNLNLDFSRVRARQRLEALSAGPRDPVTALAAIAAAATRLRAARDAQADALIEAAWRAGESSITLDGAVFCASPPETRARALGWIAAALGGAARLPDASKALALATSLAGPSLPARTLAGTRFAARASASGAWQIVARAAPPRASGGRTACPDRVIARRLAAFRGRFDEFVTGPG